MKIKRKKFIYLSILAGILMLSLACTKIDEMKKVVPIFKNGQTPQTGEKSPSIMKSYAGQGTHKELSVLGDVVISCEVPYSVTATVDDKGIVLIEGIGPCIDNYSICSLSTTDRCSINAKGSIYKAHIINLSSCNSGLEITADGLKIDDKDLWGTFECSLGGDNGDTTSLTFDIPLLK